MHVGLESLINGRLAAHVEESRAFYAARIASADTESRPDLSTPEGLQQARALEQARAKGAVSATSPGPPAVEAVAEVGGRRVPVRIIAPQRGTARGVIWTFTVAVSTWGWRHAKTRTRTPTSVQGRLTHLNDVAVRITDVAADLGLVLLRWRQELGAPRAPLGVHGLDVRDSDVSQRLRRRPCRPHPGARPQRVRGCRA